MTIDPMCIGAGTPETEQLPRSFINLMRPITEPRILELGTLRWEADLPTHHTSWIPDGQWTRSDLTAGTDVDITSDAHNLNEFEDGSFDGLVAVSVWEHLARPWIAAHAVARVLKPGGRAYICTHHTFPLHGYPNDYFRFSIEALSLLFTDAGLWITEAGYSYPGKLIPPPEITRWSDTAPCPLNVAVIVTKPA